MWMTSNASSRTRSCISTRPARATATNTASNSPTARRASRRKSTRTPKDTWVGFKADGLDFDLNIFDLYLYGPDDKNCGLYATVCTIDEDGSTITDPFVYVETHVHYRDDAGNMTDFDCDDASNYRLKLAAWDGSK